MNKNKLPKIEGLVFQAIRGLQKEEGSTQREIRNYIVQEYDIPDTEITRQVRLALKRGVSYGILQRLKGRYYSYNQDLIGGTSHADDDNKIIEIARHTKPLDKRGKGKRRQSRSRSRSHRRGKSSSKSRERSGHRERRNRTNNVDLNTRDRDETPDETATLAATESVSSSVSDGSNRIDYDESPSDGTLGENRQGSED